MITTEITGTLPNINTDIAPVMVKIQELMTKSLLLNFEQGGRPIKWDALKATGQPSYLTKSWVLRKSITGKSGENWAKSGTSTTKIKYAAVHQFGYATRNIPKRQYIMFQDADREQIMNMLSGHILKFSEPIRIDK